VKIAYSELSIGRVIINRSLIELTSQRMVKASLEHWSQVQRCRVGKEGDLSASI